MSSIEKLVSRFKAFEQNENLTIEQFHLKRYTSDEVDLNEYKNDIKELKDVQVDETLLKYLLISGTELSWTNEKIMNDKTSYLYGSFFINDVYMPIISKSTFWEPYSMGFKNKQEQLDLERLNYFQRSAHGDDGTFGCFYRHPMEYPFPIYFYDNGVYFPLSLDLDEYYDRMLDCKAVVLWQYLFVDTQLIIEKLQNEKCSNWIALFNHLEENPNRVEGLIHHLNILIKQFPKLFPDFDVTIIESKKEDLEKLYSNTKQ